MIFRIVSQLVMVIILLSVCINAQTEQTIVEKHGLIKTAGNLVIDQNSFLYLVQIFWIKMVTFLSFAE